MISLKLYPLIFTIVHSKLIACSLLNTDHDFDIEDTAFGDTIAKLNSDPHSVDNYLSFYEKPRTADYCSFTKSEEKIVPLPDREECEKFNEKFKVNENYNFIHYFGTAFDTLKSGADVLSLPNRKIKSNTIFFVGNTGSGKSTLVQILAGDNTKLYSKSVTEDKTNFIIYDGSQIGNDTITSHTIYPELLVDQETGYLLCDNPGFRDTRSPIYEIAAVYSMRKVLRNTENLKIVLVTTHSSVKRGMYRDYFTNLLSHTTDFFDINKFKRSLYLIANKVENTVMHENETIRFVPDEIIINDIGEFLKEVKTSLNKNKNRTMSITERKYISLMDADKVINTLLEKENGDSSKYERINIVRKPIEEGPISLNNFIQAERDDIRRMLLNDENMVKVTDGDYRFSLSDSALLYVNDLFINMNSYINDLSELISKYVVDYYRKIINLETDTNEILKLLTKMQYKLNILLKKIENSNNPGEYIDVISSFSKTNSLKLDCLTSFQNISALNEFLENLKDYSHISYYTPETWSMSLETISRFIADQFEIHRNIQSLFNFLNSYEVQKNKKSYERTSKQIFKQFDINVSEFDVSIERNDLISRLENSFQIMVKNRGYFYCENNRLTIISYNIIISEIVGTLSECRRNEIVILAMHTIFFDEDLNNDWLKGKYITIIAPIWEIKGTRKVNIDGISGGNPLQKADDGEIGSYGENGGPGGMFYGIGMVFNGGENLEISASGGDGQDGQEGGDGKDGDEGYEGDETDKELVDKEGISLDIFNLERATYILRGSSGKSGSDSGAGGKGGLGGKMGAVYIHNIGNDEPQITVRIENGKNGKAGKDGKPGRGGVKACDTIITKKTLKVLGFAIDIGKDSEKKNCGSRRGENGRIRKGLNPQNTRTLDNISNDSPVCVFIMKFERYYINNVNSNLSDGITKNFISAMKLMKY